MQRNGPSYLISAQLVVAALTDTCSSSVVVVRAFRGTVEGVEKTASKTNGMLQFNCQWRAPTCCGCSCRACLGCHVVSHGSAELRKLSVRDDAATATDFLLIKERE